MSCSTTTSPANNPSITPSTTMETGNNIPILQHHTPPTPVHHVITPSNSQSSSQYSPRRGTDPHAILMKSKLLRRDRFLRWKTREFRLYRHVLQCYSEHGHLKSEIPLHSTTRIVLRPVDDIKPNAFVVFLQDEKLTLAASEERERQQWISAFCENFRDATLDDIHDRPKGEKHTKTTARPTFLAIPDGTKLTEMIKPTTKERLKQKLYPNSSPSLAHVRAQAAAAHGAELLTLNEVDEIHMDKFEEPPVSGNVPNRPQSQMPYGQLKEMYSKVTFPASVTNGDVLAGVGPMVRRTGWTDERILAVGMYIDAEKAYQELSRFYERTADSLFGDQTFYDALLHSTFRKTFVITSWKRVAKSTLIHLFTDELTPRIGISEVAIEALTFFLHVLEKSLKRAESLVLRIFPDGRLEVQLRERIYPPIASFPLCQAIQGLFFDANSIQHDAKRGLADRLPSLWGYQSDSDATDDAFLSEDDFPMMDIHEFNVNDIPPAINEGEDERQSIDNNQMNEKLSRKLQRSTSIKEVLDEKNDEEHELLRRESRSLASRVEFGPLIDSVTKLLFQGELAPGGIALLGVWSHSFVYPYSTPSSHNQNSQSTESHQVKSSITTASSASTKTYCISIGLYVDTASASECLLRFKGLSLGSMVQHPEFFSRFASGSFKKQFVFKFIEEMPWEVICQFFISVSHLLNVTLPPQSGEIDVNSSSQFLDTLKNHSEELLKGEDELHALIDPSGAMEFVIIRKNPSNRIATPKALDKIDEEGTDNTSVDTENSPQAIKPSEGIIKLPPAPFSSQFQGLFYGSHTISDEVVPGCRSQLLQRLPLLLDTAKDDLVHTYQDEIQMLKENYMRQQPESRLKVGYLYIAYEKTKIHKRHGVEEVTKAASRWSKRWCRLDGTVFSFYSYKRSRKPRETIDIKNCRIMEITSDGEYSQFILDLRNHGINHSHGRPCKLIGIIKPTNEILALKTESLYEGAEWLESLTDANKVQNELVEMTYPLDEETRQRSVSRASSRRKGDEVGDTINDDSDDEAISDVESVKDAVNSSVVGGYATDNESNDELELSAHSTSLPKDGSLLQWLREDSRHQFIFCLMLCIVWLISRISTQISPQMGINN